MSDVRALKRIYSQLFAILTREQVKGSFAVFISMVACSFLELIGVSVIFPMLQIMTDEDALKESWYAGWIYLAWPQIGAINVILILGIAIIIVYISKNILAMLCSYIQFNFASKYKKEASTMMLQAYLEQPYEYFLNTNSATMLRGITQDTSAAYHILVDTFAIISQILTIVLIAVFLFMTDAFIALCAMILAGVCFVGTVLGFKGRIKRAGVDAREAEAAEYQCTHQAINGIKEVMVFDRRKYFVERYQRVAEQLQKANVTNNFLSACPDRIIEGVCISGFMGIICLRIVIGGEINTMLPILGTFAMGAFKILPSIAKVSSHVTQLVYYQFGLNGCYENIHSAKEIIDRRNELSKVYEEDMCNAKDADNRVFVDQLAVKSVSWRYKNAISNTIDNLSLTIKRGESIAFIGASGAGKTTLADIIMGLLEPQSGIVMSDDNDIFSIPHQWAKTISYVPQSVYLTDDTIRQNVAFGLPNTAIEDGKVWRALEQAQLADFVRTLPDKLDAMVGERGTKLSGGQRQRIAIARALYEDPDILVLDEATSALDNETESAVMEAIDVLQGKKTLIIVAHRLSTIQNCDRIFEISNGQAIERIREEVLSK